MINFTGFLNITKKDGNTVFINPDQVTKVSSGNNCSTVMYANGCEDTFELSAKKLSDSLNSAKISPINTEISEASKMLDETPFNFSL